MAAQQQQPLLPGKAHGPLRGEQGAPGRHEQPQGLMTGIHGADAVKDGLRHHHQPRSPAEGIIIGLQVLVLGVIPDVMQADIQQPSVPGPFEHGFGKGALKHIRKEGKNINPQTDPPP